ncbi:hypothetical protein [uncultured Pseudoteredinibacter sp.]|uniref:hypothetical protein n=1 Tax=uncultured Pseudoteredinibacter sp. TaxID=1641701 RepID=UPI00262D2295|nr:hypothetical protein [uncultured Pseudoteredinibacter sp.]
MNLNSITSMGFPKLLDRILLISIVSFLMLLLWCVYKVWATPVPGAILPAESAMTPLVVEDRVSLLDVNIINERPLFWRGRRPTVIEAAPEEEPVDSGSGDLSRVRVLGVYASGAMISGVKGKGRVKLGEEIFGWKLQKLSGNQLRFAKNGRYEYLRLEEPVDKAESENGSKKRRKR